MLISVVFGTSPISPYHLCFPQVVKERNITVNLRHNLIEVKPDSREAVFQNLESPDDIKTLKVREGQSSCLYFVLSERGARQ